MLIQTEETPNPSTLKFIPGKPVSPEQIVEFTTPEDAERQSPLADALFRLSGVTGIFLGHDFVSVTKDPAVEWTFLKTDVLAALMDFYMSGQPVLNPAQAASETDNNADDSSLVLQIKAVLDERVRPAVAQDGGDITFESFDEDSGVLYLNMRGACAGCPSATMTLKSGVENLMKHFIPEVSEIRQVF